IRAWILVQPSEERARVSAAIRHNTFFMKCLTPSVVVRRGRKLKRAARLSGRLAGPPPRQWRATIPIDFCSVKAFVTPDTESFSPTPFAVVFARGDELDTRWRARETAASQ